MTPLMPAPSRFAVALLLLGAILASAGYAQNSTSSGAPVPAPTPGSASSQRASDDNSRDTAAVVPGLPRMLRQRLKRVLAMRDHANGGRSGNPAMGGSGNGSSANAVAALLIDPTNGQPLARRTARRKFFVTDLGTLGGTQSFAYSINDSGQVVGFSRIAGDVAGHSFLYRNGTMTDLFPLNSENVLTVGPTGINNSGRIASGQLLGGVYAAAVFDSRSSQLAVLGSLGGIADGLSGVATAVSDQGDAVGYSYTEANSQHAFLHFNGAMTDLGPAGGYSVALGVNDAGTAVGFASKTPGGRAHAFVYSNGVMTDIHPFGDLSESTARGINNSGQVVGEFLTQDQTAFHAFLYTDGAFYDIGSAGSPETVALAINDRAQVVGVTVIQYEADCSDPDQGGQVPCIKTAQHAFLYEAGRLVDLNGSIPADSGWQLEWAFDINNRGQIVGYGTVDDNFHAFVLTPAVSIEQCRRGGWKTFGFKNQGRCIVFVIAGR